MNDRLLPPLPVPREHAVEVWAEMIDAGEELLRAGFATRFGPEHVEEQYQIWCRQQMKDQDRRLIHLLTELSRREAEHAQ